MAGEARSSDASAPSAPTPPRSAGLRGAYLLGAAALILGAGVCVLVALARTYSVPGESMLPTLLVGDRLVSLPYGSSEPERGDVVVVRLARDGRKLFPADRDRSAPTEKFVKRIVGLPGDRVEIDGASLMVNGVAVTGPGDGSQFVDAAGRRFAVRDEALDGRRYRVLDDAAIAGGSTSFTVEPGRYFLLGDNRDNSYDSRYQGTIAREDLLSRTGRIYWSMAPDAVRWERIWSETNPPRTP